jgi:CheY-like chemotaxis protein
LNDKSRTVCVIDSARQVGSLPIGVRERGVAQMPPPRSTGLPKVGVSHPSVALDAIGRALRSLYEDLVAEGVPERMAALVRRVESPEESHIGQGRVALVVEDDLALQGVAVAVLEETKLGVIACDSAEAALAVMQKRGGEVAFIFADLRLSGLMDGLDLARSVRTLWPTTRVVLTSGADGGRVGDLPDGVVFLRKPWRADEILCEAGKALDEPPPAVS